MLKLNIIGLVTAATVIFALFFWVPDSTPVSASSLSAAIRKAVDDVNTIHMVTYGPDGTTIGDTWIVRGKGYARLGKGFMEIDDGEYYWKRHGLQEPVTRRKSQKQFGKVWDMTFPESEFERLPAEDIVVSGENLSCYSMKNIAPFAEGPQRVYVYVTSEQRVFKNVTWMFKDEKWNLFNELVYHYNVDVDDSVFKPRLEAGAMVVDLNEELDQVADVNKCLFRETVGGFDYVVHRARALKGGGVMIFATLRPSDTNPHNGFSARIYDASPQGSNDFRIELGNARLADIDAQWFMRVPRNKRGDWTHISNGKLRLKETFSVRDESDMTIKGHEFKYVDLVADVVNWQKPISIEEAAKEVYKDQKRLSNLNWTTLDTGVYMKDGVSYVGQGSVESVSEDKYAESVVAHLKYWRDGDQKRARSAIEKAIKRGKVQVSVPGLDVGGLSEFDDDDLARAAKRQDMEAVYVAETSVSDEGLRSLTGLQDLRILNLRSTDVTDKGLEILKEIDSLERVNLRKTNVTAAGVQSLRDSNPILKIQSDFEEN